ncbi:hypothetical protein MIR68_008598 [Amoeboaphelidium protococcarum]|nr:hypothetical protein MIR68_008598 [Amoeboaphelidium protococcarum]KAI3644217.1 hypothetical protein MP228_010381 [Amoeboaphelidium protococcarum]
MKVFTLIAVAAAVASASPLSTDWIRDLTGMDLSAVKFTGANGDGSQMRTTDDDGYVDIPDKFTVIEFSPSTKSYTEQYYDQNQKTAKVVFVSNQANVTFLQYENDLYVYSQQEKHGVKCTHYKNGFKDPVDRPFHYEATYFFGGKVAKAYKNTYPIKDGFSYVLIDASTEKWLGSYGQVKRDGETQEYKSYFAYFSTEVLNSVFVRPTTVKCDEGALNVSDEHKDLMKQSVLFQHQEQ